MNLQLQAVINDSQVVGCTPSKFYSQVTWYYITRRALLCAVKCLLYYWEEEMKRLSRTIRYNYYCEPTKDLALIRDLVFIFVIMLFSLSTKRDQAFIGDQL